MLQDSFKFIHSIINTFAGGRSDSKVWLFLIYILFNLLFFFILKEKINYKNNQFLKNITIAIIFSLFLAGIGLSATVTSKFNIPGSTYYILLNNEEISSSQYLHNHVLKGMIGLISKPFLKNHTENIDPGIAFINIIPNYLLIPLSVLYIITIFLLIIINIQIINKQKDKTGKILLAIILFTSTFSIIKNIPDGGLFSSSTIPALIILLMMFLSGKKRIWSIFTLIIIYLINTILSFGLDLFHSDELDLIRYITEGLPFLTFNLVLFFALNQRKNKLLYRLLIILACLVIITPAYYEFIDSQTYDNLIINDGIIATYQSTVDGENIDKIGKLNIQKIKSSKTVGEYLKDKKILSNFYPIAIPWVTCLPSSQGDKYKFDLATISEFGTISKSPDTIKEWSIVKIEKINDVTKYHIVTILKPCTPRHLNIITEFIKQYLTEPFIIYNIN